MKKRVKYGQSLVEYGFLLALVAAVCITALQLLGGNLGALMNSMAASVTNAMNGS